MIEEEPRNSSEAAPAAPLTAEEILAQVQLEFAQMKAENLAHKAEGKKYDPHFEGINPDAIGLPEAELWQGLKEVQTKEALRAFGGKLENYRQSIRERVMAERQADSPNKHLESFLAFLNNRVTRRVMDWD